MSRGKSGPRLGGSSEHWLVGGGEMAKLIETMDWSDSALGPIESWPQSLRTTVSLAQASNSPMSLSWGADHVQIYNDGYWPICGPKHPQAMGQDFRVCWASAFPVIGEAYESAWAGKSAYLEKMRMFLDRYGFLEETWFTFSFSPITDESGGVGGVFNPVTDMTAQMLSERRTGITRDLASLAGKARTSEEAFALCTPVMVEARLDLPFCLLYAIDIASNRATLVSHTGLERGSLHCLAAVELGSADDRSWSIGEVAHSGQAKRLDDLAERLGEPSVGPYPEQPRTALVLPILLPGADLPAIVMVAGVSARLPLLDSYRAFYDLLAAGVATVVAGARAYEDEREKARALAQIDQAKSAFFSNVSHEFRTPLTLILGPMEDALLKDSLSGDDLKTAHRNALRLVRLVNGLLEFSRIEAGRLESSFEPTDLAALTAGLVGAFDSLIRSAGVKLVVTCPSLCELVYVDRLHWEKIVFNLVSNAFKFTFEGSIEVRLSTVGRHLELSVHDTGIGIAAHELPRLFQRFHRVSGAHGREFEGSGIGLALVDELARAHGGTVRVESIVGQGTTFVVSIPLGSAHLPTQRIRSEPRIRELTPGPVLPVERQKTSISSSPSPNSTVLRQRVLVADDNADMRAYLGRLLAPYWQVELVEDGRAAFDSAVARPPDLVLSDVMMPGMDGVGLVKALRDDTRTAAIPVVLLSARAGEDAVLEGLETLADDYLVKPFSSRELLTRIRTHLRMANVRQRLQAQLVIADRMAAVGMLAAGVAHEINSPLACVVSSLDLMAEELRSSDNAPLERTKRINELRQEAAQGAERVSQIVDGMKTFARADEERRVAIDVRQLLDLSIDVAFNELQQRARVIKDFGPVPPVLADVARLGQVFVNLLVNAAQSIAAGQPSQNHVRISTKTDASRRCIIEVSDTGRGIAPEILDRIFDPFFTTKGIGEGTGLGLSICHSIVRALGGEIGVESALGEGSTFRIALPGTNSEPTALAAAPTAELAPKPRPGRVLVLDDDAKVATMLGRVLDREHDVTVLTDGQEALGLLLAGENFDVVLCDLMMPKTTGMDIHATLASKLPHLVRRLVFVTGGATTKAGRAFLETIPNHHVEKPFSAQHVRSIVRAVIADAEPPATEPA